MAYVLKYRLQLRDSSGNYRTIDIEEKDFTGAFESRAMGTAMLPSLKKDISDFVMGTSLEFSMEIKDTEEFGIPDLFTEDPRKYRVNLQYGYPNTYADLTFFELSGDTIVSGDQFEMYFNDGTGSEWKVFEFSDQSPLPNPPTGVDYMLPVSASGIDETDVADALDDISDLDSYEITAIVGQGVKLVSKYAGYDFNLQLQAIGTTPIDSDENPVEASWQGFLLPEQYLDPYIYPKFDIVLSASDGLGLLKNIDFDMTGFQSELDIIQHILAKTGLVMPIAISVKIWETNMSDTTKPPMSEVYLECDQFFDDNGKPENSYDVLVKIIGSYGLKNEIFLTRGDGAWLLFRITDMQSTFYVYDIDGNYDYSVAGFIARSLGSMSSANTWPVGALGREIQKRFQKISLNQEYNRNMNIFRIGDMTELNFDAPEASGDRYPKYWFMYSVGYLTMAVEGETISMYVDQPSSDYINISDAYKIFSSTDGYKITLKVKADNSSSSTLGTLDIKVKLSNDSYTYYLTSAGSWSTTETTISENLPAAGSETTLTLDVNNIPIDGDLKFYLTGKDQAQKYYLYFVKLEYEEPPQMPSSLRYESDLSDFSINKLEQDIMSDHYNESMQNIYNNVKYLSDNSPTYRWRQQSDTSDFRLAVILMRTAASNNRTARQLLKGVITGTFDSIHTILQHTLNSSRKFYVKECVFNLFDNELDGTFEEILDYSEQTFTINKTIYYKSS